MKFLSLIAVLGFSVSALAGTTVVYHDYDGALRGIALNNACVTDTEVQSISATRNCTKLVPVEKREGDYVFTDWVCQSWETSKVSYPRAFTRTYCAEYAYESDNMVCVKTAEKSDFLPKTIKVAVVTGNGEYDNFPGVTKSHTFPACQ